MSHASNPSSVPPEVRVERRATPRRSPAQHTPAEQETAAHFLEQLRAGGDARGRKVRRVRAAIRCTAYENDLKLTVAIDRLASDLERS